MSNGVNDYVKRNVYEEECVREIEQVWRSERRRVLGKDVILRIIFYFESGFFEFPQKFIVLWVVRRVYVLIIIINNK
jgi:hypothetical protein